MIDKVVASVDEAVAGIQDGAVILVGGFGGRGGPYRLIPALARRGVRNLTIVSNNMGMGIDGDVGMLYRNRQVGKAISTYPLRPGADDFKAAVERGETDLEILPQGTLVERLKAGGSGLGGFYTPTGVGTAMAEGKEVREIDGKLYLLEKPLHADFALLHARQGDRYGNLRYHGSARNFNPVMAPAADVAIVEVEELVPLGNLDPDDIHTPGIFIDRVTVVGR